MKAFVLVLCFVTLATSINIPLSKQYWQNKIKNHVDKDSRIVGGQEAEPHSRPYQIGILNEQGSFICGGSLIKRNFVMTAAQCIDDGKNPATVVTLVFGAHDIFDQQNGLRLQSRTFFIHPGYNPKSLSNDLALIKLPGDVELTDKVQLVNLPLYSALANNFSGEKARISGWGKISDDSQLSQNLQELEMAVITNSVCNVKFLGVIQGSQLCTNGVINISTCGGDFGGPLTLLHKGRITQIGIASFTMEQGCQTGWPPVFTRVTSYVDWISNTAGISILP